MTQKQLKDFQSAEIKAALKAGTFTLHLGPFSHLVSGYSDALLDHLFHMYRHSDVELTPSDVTEVILNIRAPNVLRRFIRPQVTPDPGFQVPTVPLPRSMAALAYEMGLNLSVALKCCRFVTVHAGVVADDRGAIIMSAESGGGKSTLTAALNCNGYRLFSDEFALISLDDGALNPYPRPISLKQESIPIVQEFAGVDRVSKALTGTPKGNIAYYQVAESDLRRAHETADARLILLPKFALGAQAQARKLSPAEAVMRLIPASTNYSLLGEPAFKALLKIVKRAPAYEITYGATEQGLELVKELSALGAAR